MKQRQSIPFKKPEKDVTLSTASYLIDNFEIPIIFLKLEETYGEQNILEPVETFKDVEFVNAMSDFLLLTATEPAVAIIEPSLCIVGNNTNYYVVDLYNEIFYTSTTPQYEFPQDKKVNVTFYKKKMEPQAKKIKTKK